MSHCMLHYNFPLNPRNAKYFDNFRSILQQNQQNNDYVSTAVRLKSVQLVDHLTVKYKEKLVESRL